MQENKRAGITGVYTIDTDDLVIARKGTLALGGVVVVKALRK